MSDQLSYPYSSARYIVVYRDDRGILHRDRDPARPTMLYQPSVYGYAKQAADAANADPSQLFPRGVALVTGYCIAEDHVTGMCVALDRRGKPLA